VLIIVTGATLMKNLSGQLHFIASNIALFYQNLISETDTNVKVNLKIIHNEIQFHVAIF
jgi:hypothetical protein